MMTRLIFVVCIAIGQLIPGDLLAQLPQSPEYLYARVDKDFYLAGEDIWYSLHVLNPSEQQSAIVYVDFHGPNGELIDKQILKLENQLAVGDISLPSDLRQGYYMIRAYTAWNLNYSPQEILEKEIPVYEAKLLSDGAELADASASPDLLTVHPSEGLKIVTNKSSYLPREPIDIDFVELALSGGTASVSVSIVGTDFVENEGRERLQKRLEEIRKKTRVKIAGGRQPVPPETAYTRSFVLKNLETNELINSNFVMGYIKQTQQKLIQSAENGIVSFTFEDFYDSTIVQIFDTNPFHPTYIPDVSLISSFPSIQPARPNRSIPEMTAAVQKYIDGYQKRYQLNKLFGLEGNIRAPQADKTSLSLTPTTIYRVDDFVQHESLADFVKNVVPPIKVVKAKKNVASVYASREGETLRQFKLFVPNKDNRGTEGVVKKTPIILINDYFTYDAESVLKMEWENVRQIDVFNTAQSLPVQFGPIGNFGVIGIRTRDGKTPASLIQSANNLVIPGFYQARTFGNQKTQTSEYSQSKVPNFLPMMYWNPRVELNQNSPNQLTVIASDQPGSYLIRVEGVGKWGNLLIAEKVIQIGF
ncbi:MAG: hypothetical protein AAF587_16215 [Bacteroidota bacterium]